MEEKITRIKLWSEGKKQGPVSIHLDLSNRCNLTCKFCWQRSHERMGLVDYSNELSEEKLLSTVKEAADLGVQDWLISGGGEPFIRTDTTIRVMKEIKRYHMFGDIITNGTLFRGKDIEELVKVKWDRIRVSMNGPNKEMHDFLVDKKGAFDKVITALKLIKRLQRKYENKLPEIGFNTVINCVNYKTFPELVKLLIKIRGSLINVQTIILYDEKEKEWTLNKDQRKEFNKIIKKVLKITRRHNIHTNIGEYLSEDVVDKSSELGKMNTLMETNYKGFIGSHCFEPWYLVTIRANGIVGSCRLFGDKGTSIQNKSLKQIWFGSYYSRIRKRLINHDLPDYCKNCGANEFLENQRIREELIKAIKNGK